MAGQATARCCRCTGFLPEALLVLGALPETHRHHPGQGLWVWMGSSAAGTAAGPAASHPSYPGLHSPCRAAIAAVAPRLGRRAAPVAALAARSALQVVPAAEGAGLI